MSTTYESILILGCKGEFRDVTRLEPRFDPKTGKPCNPAPIFDHCELYVGDKMIWSGESQCEADEWAEDNTVFRVVSDYMQRGSPQGGAVFVGKILAQLDDFGHKEILPSTDSGVVAELLGQLGTVPTLWLIQDAS